MDCLHVLNSWIDSTSVHNDDLLLHWFPGHQYFEEEYRVHSLFPSLCLSSSFMNFWKNILLFFLRILVDQVLEHSLDLINGLMLRMDDLLLFIYPLHELFKIFLCQMRRGRFKE